jgi:hypothetical protein
MDLVQKQGECSWKTSKEIGDDDPVSEGRGRSTETGKSKGMGEVGTEGGVSGGEASSS